MGLRKKNKASAEFSMSSLTDIIFLLLIFFMLTSSLVVPNALNLKLPGKRKSNTELKAPPAKIDIRRDGSYWMSGSKVSLNRIEKAVKILGAKGRPVSLIVSPNPNAPNQYVVAIMDIAYRYHVETILQDPY
ncbi:MAG: biopolymer transport protein ExbD [Saprospiraceae bacterium]|jgi:biopolymer transport protein ExbD